MLTGTVGKLITELMAAFPTEDEGKAFMEAFMEKNLINWCAYRPNTFEGNQVFI